MKKNILFFFKRNLWKIMIAIMLISNFSVTSMVKIVASTDANSYDVWTTVGSGDDCFLIKLASDGTEKIRIPKDQLSLPSWPDGRSSVGVAINQVDGTIWVWSVGITSGIAHLSADAQDILASWTVSSWIKRLTIDTTDGGVWLSGGYDPYTFKYSSEGSLITTISSSHSHWCGWVSVNSVEQTVWFTNDFTTIQKLKPDGSVLFTVGGFNHQSEAISVDETDGSLWVADNLNNEVVKIDTNGNELVRVNVGPLPIRVVANQEDGGAWVSFRSTTNEPVKRLDSNGNIIATSDILCTNAVRGIDIASDGTVWVAEFLAHKIHKLSTSGELLLSVGGDPATYYRPSIISIYPKIAEPTIPETIQTLIEDVETLNLQQGIENSLDAKLENVLDSLDAVNADQRNDAINKLYAFINSVEAQRGKNVTNEQADYLIAEAQRIISLIQE